MKVDDQAIMYLQLLKNSRSAFEKKVPISYNNFVVHFDVSRCNPTSY